MAFDPAMGLFQNAAEALFPHTPGGRRVRLLPDKALGLEVPLLSYHASTVSRIQVDGPAVRDRGSRIQGLEFCALRSEL